MAKPKKTHEEFISEMNEINSNILILGKYIGARDKVKCKCLIDGNEWEAMPTNLLKGDSFGIVIVLLFVSISKAGSSNGKIV